MSQPNGNFFTEFDFDESSNNTLKIQYDGQPSRVRVTGATIDSTSFAANPELVQYGTYDGKPAALVVFEMKFGSGVESIRRIIEATIEIVFEETLDKTLAQPIPRNPINDPAVLVVAPIQVCGAISEEKNNKKWNFTIEVPKPIGGTVTLPNFSTEPEGARSRRLWLIGDSLSDDDDHHLDNIARWWICENKQEGSGVLHRFYTAVVIGLPANPERLVKATIAIRPIVRSSPSPFRLKQRRYDPLYLDRVNELGDPIARGIDFKDANFPWEEIVKIPEEYTKQLSDLRLKKPSWEHDHAHQSPLSVIDQIERANESTRALSNYSIEPVEQRSLQHEDHLTFSEKLTKLIIEFVAERHLHTLQYSDLLNNLQRLGIELAQADPDLIRIQLKNTDEIVGRNIISGVSNLVKGLIEKYWGERWDWWPLSPYRRKLLDSEARVYWISRLGCRRDIEVPEELGREILELLRAQVAIKEESGPFAARVQASQHTERASTNQRAATGSRSASKPSSSKNVTRRRPTKQRISVLDNADADESQSNNDESSDEESESGVRGHTEIDSTTMLQDLHLFLVVPKGHRYLLSQTKFSQRGTDAFSFDDIEFFSWIRTEYRKHRGWVVRYFSIWQYSHCEYYLCEKFLPGKYGPLKEQYPNHKEYPEYEFHPKPMKPIPPFPWNEWYERFYYGGEEERERKSNKALGKLPTSKPPGGASHKVVAAVPKRVRGIDENSYERDEFFGLFARDIFAYRILVLWMTLCCTPSIVFFGLWMFKWKHYDQLTAALNPLALTLTLFIFLITTCLAMQTQHLARENTKV